MTVQFIATLFQLRAEAEATDQPFLAHVIGLAILEANEIVTAVSLADGSRVDGSRR